MTQDVVEKDRQEAYLERRLKMWGIKFCWVSDRAKRIQRFRAAIIEGFIDQAFVGRKLDGSAETFGQLFERIFNEPLRPRQSQPATKLREATMSETNTVEIGS